MPKHDIIEFLVKARTATYAGASGKSEPAFKQSFQLEYKDKDWFYRDVYNNGNGIFVGFETIYYKENVVWSMSYFGNYKKLSEEEVDKILRKSLVAKKDTTRLWNNVSFASGMYEYRCEGYGDINELGGTEKILKEGKEVYLFYYAGGVIANL